MIPALFFALVFLVAALPFVPAFREMRLNRDATPLAVSRRSRVDVRHFANGLRDFLVARIGEVIDEVATSHVATEGTYTGVGSCLVAPAGAELESADLRDRIVVGTGNLHIRGGGLLTREVYVRGDLQLADPMQLRAALAEAQLELPAGSTVLRWIHAGKHLIAGESCRLFGRASADEALFLRTGTEFERLHAPTILVGDARSFEAGQVEPTRRLDPEELGPQVEVHAGRVLIHADLRIPEDVLVDYDLVVYGDLSVGRGSRVRGNLKAHGRVVAETGTRLEGSVVATRGVEVRTGTYVHGPILSEGDLRIEADTRIGDPDRATTARARNIVLCDRARVHGTLWASEGGRVVKS